MMRDADFLAECRTLLGAQTVSQHDIDIALREKQARELLDRWHIGIHRHGNAWPVVREGGCVLARKNKGFGWDWSDAWFPFDSYHDAVIAALKAVLK